MDEITALRERLNLPSADKLIAIARTGVSRTRDNHSRKEEYLSELDAKLEKLSTEITTLNESLSAKEHDLLTKRQEYAEASHELNELTADRSKVLLEVHQLESRKHNLKNTKPSTRDQETLQMGKQKLDYYKKLTGVRWDFGAPKDTVKGYVTNGKDYVHAFKYPKTEQNSAELEDDLWNEVARATGRLELAESAHG